MARAWVEVPRFERVRVRKGPMGAIAVGYMPAPAGVVPIAAAGADERRARRALVGALRVLASDPTFARKLGLRTVALPPGVSTGEAVRLGQLVGLAREGKAPARAKLRRLRAMAHAGDARAESLWALARSQNGRGRVTRAAHYAPHVAAAMAFDPRPAPAPPPPLLPPWWPAVSTPPPQPPVGYFPPSMARAWQSGLVETRLDSGTSALLNSTYGPRTVRGLFSWGR